MQLQRFDSVDAFMQAAGPYLLAREAEHNLILGIAASLAVDADTYAGPPMLVTVGPADGDPAAVAIRTPPHNLLLSEVDDPGVVVPVLVSGLAGETLPGVGPVYTPPEERGHGYASRLTAAVSRTMLEEGRRYCFLYTDLGNKTANHVYQAIGYRPVTDAVMLRFSS